jgi:hypothetical protein
MHNIGIILHYFLLQKDTVFDISPDSFALDQEIADGNPRPDHQFHGFSNKRGDLMIVIATDDQDVHFQTRPLPASLNQFQATTTVEILIR